MKVHKLTRWTAMEVNKMAAPGVKLQDLAPVVGLAAEFAAAAHSPAITAAHVKAAARALGTGQGGK